MKVLFAVSNENISSAIVKRYPKEYTEILSYKNVYYFNAILKEIQKDKSYDRIVISEDLEPFVNSNHDSIDNFIFDHLDKISDEAHDSQGKETSIILICSERRTPGSQILSKLFSIGIYNAVMGKDRNLTELCRLINCPRTKKEAKIYYGIEQANYESVSESAVNETEIQNILTHFKKLGKNTDRYADSFNNIASQYTDEQLKIIINVLPIKVKAVLESESPKYQELMGVNEADARMNAKANVDQGISINTIGKSASVNGPVVIPTSVKKEEVSSINNSQTNRVAQPNVNTQNVNPVNTGVEMNQNQVQPVQAVQQVEPVDAVEIHQTPVQPVEPIEPTQPAGQVDPVGTVEPIKQVEPAGMEEPQNVDNPVVNNIQENATIDVADDAPKKRGRGRPRKNPLPEDKTNETVTDDDVLPGMEENTSDTLPGMEDNPSDVLPGMETGTDDILPGMEDNSSDTLPGIEIDSSDVLPGMETSSSDILPGMETDTEDTSNNGEEVDIDSLLKGLDDNEGVDEIPDENAIENTLEDNNEDSEDDFEKLLNGENEIEEENVEDDPVIEEMDNDETILPGMGFDDVNSNASSNPVNSTNGVNNNLNNINNGVNNLNNYSAPEMQNPMPNDTIETVQPKVNYSMSNLNGYLSKDKKIVSFVGTTKNGTSFLVNNLALMFSLMGIDTAILDMTENRNSYYIFTDSREDLRNIAYTSIGKLENGYPEGIKVNKNFTVYTALPADGNKYENAEPILSTLVQNHSLVLIDCDFKTQPAYFASSQEIYLVQSMDVLTIQPLTEFLRDLKFKGAWEPEKARVVINKEVKIKSLNEKIIIAGMSRYNGPDMSVMTDLFNKDMVKACTIPFDEKVYSKYLETIATCKLSLNGYSKPFMQKLQILGEMVYPMLNSKKTYGPMDNVGTTQVNTSSNSSMFSNNTNSTLNQMKSNY